MTALVGLVKLPPHHVELCIFCAAPHLIGEGGLGIILRVSVVAVFIGMSDVDSMSHTIEFVLFVAAFSLGGRLAIAVASGVGIVAPGVVIVIGYQLLNSRLECSL